MISFASRDRGGMPLDAVVARGNDGRLSAMLVHLSDKQATYHLSGLANALSNCDILLKMDEGTGNGIISGKYDGGVRFEGYGVAVVTNKAPEA
jgi:hypothetical protein